MKRQIRASILAGLLLVTSGTAFSQQSSKPLTNVDIISMVKASLADDIIVSSIQVSGGSFDVSPEGLITLNKAGVSMRVMEAMIGNAIPRPPDTTPAATLVASGTPLGGATAVPAVAQAPGGAVMNVAAQPYAVPGSPAFGPAAANSFVGGAPSGYGGQMPGQFPGQMPGQMPGQFPGQMAGMPGMFPGMEPQPTVNLVSASANAPLYAERLQSVSVVAKGGSSGNLNGGTALSQMFSAGAADVANRMMNGVGSASAAAGVNVVGGLLTKKSAVSVYVWALRGKLSANVVAVHRPSFEVSFADIPGVDPDQFEPHIVRVESTKNNLRLVGATKVTDQANSGAFGIVYSPFFEHEVDVDQKLIAPGHMRVTPNKDLAPGEYAVALRPVSKKKTFSGDAVSRNDGEGLLFNTVWSFSVK